MAVLSKKEGFGPDGKVPASTHFAGKPVADTPMDHLSVQLSTLPKLALAAYLWMHWCSGLTKEAAASFDPDWMKSVIVRDLIITWLVAGGWDTLVYSRFSPFFARLRGHKLNPVEPVNVGTRDTFVLSITRWQFAHDAFWSTMSTLISSAAEIALAHAYATGRLGGWAEPGGSWWLNKATLAWIVTMPYWRLAHFYTIHRAMHKWFPGRAPGTGWCPDVGAFLYKYVHALHHLSKNPTAWSGISMHPIESSTYYTAMLLPIAVSYALGLAPIHPIVLLYTKMDLTIAALVGHDGIGYPGGASQAHWLHHSLIDCNYGENYAPFDWLFGTWAKDEEDFQAKGLSGGKKNK